MFLIEGTPTAVVAELSAITGSGGRKLGSRGLPLCEQLDPSSTLTVRPMESSVNGTENEVTFGGASSGGEKMIPGPFAQATTPGVRKEGNDVILFFPIQILSDIAQSLWLRIVESSLNTQLVTAPTSIRHRDASTALFTVGAAEAQSAQSERTCFVPGCNFKITDSNLALNHASFHRIFTPEVLKFGECCPLCLGDSNDCEVFLEKTGASAPQPRIFCIGMNPGASSAQPDSCIRFSAKPMSTSTMNMPSSNAPIVCPVCHPELANPTHQLPGTAISTRKKNKWRPAVMKYNFKSHWHKKHQSVSMPLELASDLTIGEDERNWLRLNRGFKVTASQIKARRTSAHIQRTEDTIEIVDTTAGSGENLTCSRRIAEQFPSSASEGLQEGRWFEKINFSGYHLLSHCPSPSAPWNMRSVEFAVCVINESIVTGRLFPCIRAKMPAGTEYTSPNAKLVTLDASGATYDVIIHPAQYCSNWVALEANVASAAPCCIEGGCQNPRMALGNRHFCAACGKGPLHALCCLALTSQDTIYACSSSCFKSKTTSI